MSDMIPETHLDLLEEAIVVAFVTLMPDGQPQATAVWCSYDGSHIWVNAAKGRQKDRNVRECPLVTVLAIDPKNPYRYLEVRGIVDEITEEGALEHINQLSQQYFGETDFYARNPGGRGKEVRVIYKIKPQHINAH